MAKPNFALGAKSLELVQMACTMLFMRQEWVEKAGLTLGEGSEAGLGLRWKVCLVGSTLSQMLLVPAGSGSSGELGAAASVLTELGCPSMSCSSWLSFIFSPCYLNLSIAPCP